MFASPLPEWMNAGMSNNIDPSLMQTGKVKPKGGMFGGGGWADAVQAALGGYLASMGNPVGAQALQNLHTQKMLKQRQTIEEQQYQRQRQDGMSDWIAKQQYQAEHPNPVNNDTVADYNFFSQTLGPEAGKQFLQTKLNPIVMTPYGPMPYSAVNGGGQAPATRPVGRLTPIEDGGPTPQASGGFPSFGY